MEQRIEKLERQCWWYRNFFILAGLVAVALVTWGATKPIPDVIRARGFEVVAPNGKTVAELRRNLGTGEGKVWVWGRTGSGLMTGGFLSLHNSTNEPVVALQTLGGIGMVSVYNSNGMRGRHLTPNLED